MDEPTIEFRVERAIDRADAAFMAGKLSQAEYDAKIAAINDWAERRYQERRAAALDDFNYVGSRHHY